MRKTAIILLFVMVINLFPSFAFADSTPAVRVTGNIAAITSRVAPGERTTITITDRDNINNIRFIDQKTFEDGNASFAAELDPGKYKVFISTSQNKQSADFEISGDVTVNGEYVSIKGTTQANSMVTLTVLNERNAVVHVDQASSDSKGEYSFSIQLEAGNYKAYIKSSAEEEAKVYEFSTYKADVAYTLSPENQSKNNKYNNEFSIEFDFPVEIVNDGSIQLTLEEKKSDGSGGHIYPELKNVMKIDSNNPRKVVIDLKLAGERLDVDRYYTVKLYDNVIKNKETGNPVKLSDISWVFDTVWNEYRPNDMGTGNGGKFDWDELERLNGFRGLYAGQIFQVKYVSPTMFDFDKNQYPLNFEAYPKNLAEIDRNGILTVRDNVQGTIYVTVSAEKMIGELAPRIEIKNNLKQKLQILKQEPVGVVSDLRMSEKSDIYFKEGNLIKAYDKDLNIKESFFVYTLKSISNADSGVSFEKLYDIVNINGREYLNVSLVKFAGTGDGYTNLIDAETGEIYRDEIPLLGVQLKEGSSIFTVLEGQYIRFYDVVKKEFEGGRYKYEGSGPKVKAYDGMVYILHRGYLDIISYEDNREKNIDLSSLNIINYSRCNFIVSRDGYIYITESGRDYGKLFKIDSEGKKLWGKTEYLGIAGSIIEFEDGNIGIGVKINTSDNEPDILLNVLEAGTGDLIKAVPTYAAPFSDSTDLNYLGEHAPNIYVNGMVLNSSYEPVAYTDISSPGRKVNGSICLMDGYIYRISCTYGDYSIDYRLEKGRIIDEYTSVPAGIVMDDEIIVVENTDVLLNASITDQYGFITKGNIKFDVETNDIIFVEGSTLKVKSLGEKSEQQFNMTVSVEGTSLYKTVKIIVRKISVPQRLYIVDSRKGNKIEDNNVINEINITTKAGGGFWVFVEDQYGEFLTLQPVDYIVGDESIAGTRLYYGGSGDENIKYQVMVDPLRVGETTITARLRNYPDISAVINVKVTDVNYEIIWETGTDGPWGSKKAYHVDGIYEDFIYTNENYLAALNKYDGSQLWKTEVGAYYGMEISPPYIDDKGIIYVHDLKSTAVAAVNSKDGERLWRRSYGSDEVVNFRMSSQYLYVLTDKGMLMKLDKSGNKLWEVKAAAENAKDMEVSPDGKVYVVSRNIIYYADEGGSLKEMYRADQSDKLNIRDISSNGCLIVEKTDSRSQYEALCISSEGQLKWKRSVVSEFTAQWEADRVYILSHVQSRAGSNSYLYAYDEAGEEVFGPIKYLPSAYTGISYYEKERKPVVKNGRVYTYIDRTYCFDSMTGKELWDVYIRDTYDPSRPYSLTVGDDGTVYTSTGGRGMFAYIVKGQNSEGVSISVVGRPVLKNDSLSAISLNLHNNTEADYENMAVSAELQDISDADNIKSISKIAMYTDLSKGQKEDFKFHINIPSQGKYKILIKASDKDGNILDISELPVNTGGK